MAGMGLAVQDNADAEEDGPAPEEGGLVLADEGLDEAPPSTQKPTDLPKHLRWGLADARPQPPIKRQHPRR